ncbi:LysR family transcriptional regulator [Massilia glaciei]|uniref:LysR family transcriptional regulator n=1 Tax=Massilia glaciei TaxID=1524097 RepID=A0A2U2HME4_9BURK|nr:LysR family transcriptional regulator [Massilia glaciei]PWF48595.1 LysR family transcriptional regulator [Massilia glaciei]
MREPPFHLVRAFVAVVEHHSFAGAAKELNMTASSVSRLVKALESQVGAKLINRTTRAMSLTEPRQRYFDDCAGAFERLRGAYECLRDEQVLPRGTLKLSVPVAFGRTQVVPHLSAFMQAFPCVEIDLLVTDRYVDIVAEGVTVAIRIGSMPDSTLVARKLLRNRRILVAAPAYLARHGVPASVDELGGHQCLVSTASHDGEHWRLSGPGGERLFAPRGRLRSDSGDAVKRLAIDGLGIAFHSAVTMADAIGSGELVQILGQWSGRETGVYCVFPPRAPGAAALAFVDFLQGRWHDSFAPDFL